MLAASTADVEFVKVNGEGGARTYSFCSEGCGTSCSDQHRQESSGLTRSGHSQN